jgi:hypothetical protein
VLPILEARQPRIAACDVREFARGVDTRMTSQVLRESGVADICRIGYLDFAPGVIRDEHAPWLSVASEPKELHSCWLNSMSPRE